MSCCGGVTRDNSGENIQIIGGLSRMQDRLDTLRGRGELADAIKSHKTAIDVAIKTGDMDQVRQVNEEWFRREIAEVEAYARMTDG
jgi:hypothetical protein